VRISPKTGVGFPKHHWGYPTLTLIMHKTWPSLRGEANESPDEVHGGSAATPPVAGPILKGMGWFT
jgi:hypothetical protein